MKIALITIDTGVPRTLATTAFVLAFADGLTRLGVPVRVVGLVQREDGWQPEALSPVEAVTPWLSPHPPRLGDVLEAARNGILDNASVGPGAFKGAAPDWYLESLLQRELDEFARGESLALVVYPIYYPVLRAAVRVAGRRAWKLIVQSCEAMSGSWIDPATRNDYIKMVGAEADGVWALSTYLAEYWISQGVAPERTIVQPSIVRADAFRSDPLPQTHTAVYLGNLQHREIEYLLEIATTVQSRLPGFHLTVYGDATDERRAEIAAIVEERGLARTVAIERSVRPAEVPQVLSGADLLLLPRASGEFSTAGFPNKLGEYLASGRPVVATRVGDIPTYLVDGESAYLVEPDDCEAFAEAVVRALEDPRTATRIGQAGRRVASDLLASPTAARRIVDFITVLPAPDYPRVKPHMLVRRLWPAAVAVGSLASARIWPTLSALRSSASGVGRSLSHRARYTKAGHTRLMAAKILAVRVLRFLHLKPPAPEA